MRRLNAELRSALVAPELLRRFADLGLAADPRSPEELDVFMKSEVVRQAGIKLPE